MEYFGCLNGRPIIPIDTDYNYHPPCAFSQGRGTTDRSIKYELNITNVLLYLIEEKGVLKLCNISYFKKQETMPYLSFYEEFKV